LSRRRRIRLTSILSRNRVPFICYRTLRTHPEKSTKTASLCHLPFSTRIPRSAHFLHRRRRSCRRLPGVNEGLLRTKRAYPDGLSSNFFAVKEDNFGAVGGCRSLEHWLFRPPAGKKSL
jgi:hypothetical protein